MTEGSFKGIFDAAREEESEKSDSQISKKKVSQTSEKSDSQITEEEIKANLCIKIPKSLRNYWIGSARTEGTTVTAVLTQYLTERYGTPDNPRNSDS